MAEHFHKQAKIYAEVRPGYPPELFRFIASKTPHHHLAWDVATGSGQAAVSLAVIYESVVATDASAEQLACAPPVPNVRYHHTPPAFPPDDLELHVGRPGTVDIVTVAQALHWFDPDFPSLYTLVNRALRRPGGVFAAWCYKEPRVDDRVDAAYDRFFESTRPYSAPQRRILEEMYAGLEFPFDPVEGRSTRGPSSSVRRGRWTWGRFWRASGRGRPTRRRWRRGWSCWTMLRWRSSSGLGAATAPP